MKYQYLEKDIIYNIYIIKLKKIIMILEIAKENDIIYIIYKININNQVIIKVIIKFKQ